MKRLHVLLASALIGVLLCLAVGLAGCDFWQPTRHAAPTEPEAAPAPAGAPANFYASRPVDGGDGYGVYSQQGLIVVQVPEAGDYLLVYQTDTYISAAAFRAAESALAYIGVNEGEEVSNAWILAGALSSIPADAQQSGAVTLCAWPGSQTFALDIFDSPAFDLIQQEYRAFVEAQE